MKYIFFDIDGTLLDNSRGIIESTVLALEKAKAKGHKVFINTGRSYAELGTGFKKFNFDGYVCAAGSYIKIGEEVIFDKEIPGARVKELVDLLRGLDLNYALEGVQFTYFTEPVFQGFRERVYKAIEGILDMQPNGYEPYHYMLQPAFVRREEEYYKEPTPIHKLLVYALGPKEIEELQKNLPDDYYLIVYGNFAELINKGINKATGIRAVLDHYKADIKDSIAIGDSLNDLEMLKEAGIGIAMGNASDQVKAYSDLVAPHILEDGIYRILEDLDII
ncbi:MAG: HAD family hydrolase [Tissierellia bacterium]|nr:HAD family hydrolase [Tissierellia bacterium]